MTTIDAATSLGSAGYDDADLQQKAKDHLWMHFARQSTMEENGVPIITRGEGHHIYDIHGREYFDGLSGLFVVNAMAVISYPQLWGFDCPAGIHMHFTWGAILLGLVVFGPGKLSLDALVLRRLGLPPRAAAA